MTPPTAETRVRQQLDEAEEPLDQEELIELLQRDEIERKDILRALRVLMDKDEISYSLDWDLQLEQ